MTTNDSLDGGSLQLCVRARSVRFAGREAKLPDLSFRLLQVLSERAPAEASFGDIERAVWGAHVTRETLKQRAKLLRDALVGLGLPDEVIAAARSVGYRLTVPAGLYDASDRIRVRRRFLNVTALAAAGLAAVIGAAAFATGALWQQPPSAVQVEVTETLATESTNAAASNTVSRDLANYLSLVEGVDVLAGPPRAGRVSDLTVDVAITGDGPYARLSLRLVDAHSSLILWAEDYPFDAMDYERSLAHFANHMHTHASMLSLSQGRSGQRQQPRAAREEYEALVELTRGAGEQDLLVAWRRLDALVEERPGFVLARSMRIRVIADLVLRHGRDAGLAASAVADARLLVEDYPFAADLRYALARAQLAAGDQAGALLSLHTAARSLPFLERDILVLERQMREASSGEMTF